MVVARSELRFYLSTIAAFTPVHGGYMAAAFEGEPNGVRRFGAAIETHVDRIFRIDPKREMTWRGYRATVAIHSAVSAATFHVSWYGRSENP